MEYFLRNLSAPDNVPIVLLFVLLALFLPSVAVLARRRYPLGSGDDVGKLPTWPYLLRIEFVAAILVVAALIAWSIVLDAPLEERADPTHTPNPAKAPWYFVGLQEMLVYFDPWIAGVVLPMLIVVGLVALPYVDVNPKGNGYYTYRERRFAVTVFLVGFLGLWVLFIAVGTFCRGPGWMWFWPWEPWDPDKRVAESLANLSDRFGVPSGVPAALFGSSVLAVYFGTAMGAPYLLLRRRSSSTLAKLGGARYLLVSFLLASMGGLVVKIALRHFLHVRYVVVTPWFNI